MSLFSLIAALLLEQMHPLYARKYLYGWLGSYAAFFQDHLNAGEHKHGQIAWLLAVLLPVALTVPLYWLLKQQHVIFAWAFCVLVLYLTMGFRQFSHYFTDIHKALREKDLDQARALLADWRSAPCDDLNAEEIARVTIEKALLAAHRNVFGVVVWFVIFMLLGLGPSGAILYRLAQFLNARWGRQDSEEFGEFGAFAAQAYRVLEWLPMRLTASTFAIVGDFEDAVYCWRNQAPNWPDPEAGIVLASGAGALGVRLGMTIEQDGVPLERPEIGVGDEADVDYLQSTVGLVWRALVFWLIALLLLGVASMAHWGG
ncbi:MAG TPA: CobD/CbiB family protein [Gallionellaceae bacterium]|nr:CobD/CbiB family protein [Gallionellaceae bacterium]